jgi:hypothetical protein
MPNMKDLQGMIRDGANKVMAGYEKIKSEANPNVIGSIAGSIKRVAEGGSTTRSGAPAPNRYKPLK